MNQTSHINPNSSSTGKNPKWIRSLTVISILSAITACGVIGCDHPDNPQAGSACQVDEDCASQDANHQTCLSNGQCGQYLEQGATCDPQDSEYICKDPYRCIQNVCQAENEVCHSDEDCASKDDDHKNCLSHGKCGKYLNENDPCDAQSTERLCKDPFICLNSICQTEEIVCQNNEDCASKDDDHKTCLSNGKCGQYLASGATCDPQSTESLCESPLICHQKTCKTEEQARLDEQCHSNEDCASKDADHQTCLPNNICGKYVEQGEACSDAGDSERMCHEGFGCYDICLQLLDDGESCENADTRHVICNSPMSCVTGLNECHQYKYNLDKGETCNSVYLSCKSELTCYAQNSELPAETKCTLLVGEDDECDESANVFCGDNLYCKETTINDTVSGNPVTKQICTPLGPTCEDSTECTEKDSYCCLSKDTTICSETEYGHCIPYDDNHTYDEMCLFRTKPGIFEAQIQCRWQPEEYTSSTKVEMPPLVGKFGRYLDESGKELDTVVAFFSYKTRYSSNVTYNTLVGTIRFINPNTCKTLESIRYDLTRHDQNMPGAADLDGDGLLEFITFNCAGKTVAFKWNDELQGHEVMWTNEQQGPSQSTGSCQGGSTRYNPKNAFVQVFDINNDGLPEVIVGNTVINGQNGNTIYSDDSNYDIQNGAIGYFNKDSGAFLIISNKVYEWDLEMNNSWKEIATLPATLTYKAYADFGTPGQNKTKEDFNYKTLDGFPEIVAGGGGKLQLYTLIPKEDEPGKYDVLTLMDVRGFVKGGPLTVGDFDSDGLPEIAVASQNCFGVYDPQCTEYEAGKCADENVLWERWSQDESSGRTGSSLFDFDGDGQSEAVYADECFLRVYEGKTGKVLFSSRRSSVTTSEAPVIADIDDDGSAEIMMGSDDSSKCHKDTPGTISSGNCVDDLDCVDPIHEGIRCEDDEDCPTNNCKDGLCRCTETSECNTQYYEDVNGNKIPLMQYVCVPPIDPDVGMLTNPNNENARTMVKDLGTRPDSWGTTDTDKVCRATRKADNFGIADLMIFRDRLDRWVSSRNLWNQHAYNIINIKDDGKVPSTSEWLAKFTETILDKFIEGTTNPQPKYNNYRLNEQGKYGAGKVPDITGRFIAGSVCGTKKDSEGNPVLDDNGNEIHVISGKLCNRGTKPASSELPATFFYYDENAENHRGESICTSYTGFTVEQGRCYIVGCELSNTAFEALPGRKVLMIANLNEYGYPNTVECNDTNNTDTIEITSCDDGGIVPDN